MVVKIQASHPSMSGTLQYNNRKVEKGAARIVGTFNIPGDGGQRAIERIFSAYEWRNIRSERLSFQMSVNPDPSRKEERLTDAEMLSYIRSLMHGLGYGEQPIAIYEHRDIERVHYHVVSIRTNKQGRKIGDFHERKTLQTLMKQYAEQYHYMVGKKDAVRKTIAPRPEVPRFDPRLGAIRHQYTILFQEAMKWHFTTFTQLQTIMLGMGVKVGAIEGENWKIILQGLDRKGKLVRGRIGQKELGEDLYREFELRAMECRKATPVDRLHRDQLRRDKMRIAGIIAACLRYSTSQAHLERMLAKKGITMTLSRGATGSIFGATFADATSLRAFKASELGDRVKVALFREADDPATGQWHHPSPEDEMATSKEVNEYKAFAMEVLKEMLGESEAFGRSRDEHSYKRKKKGPRKARYN